MELPTIHLDGSSSHEQRDGTVDHSEANGGVVIDRDGQAPAPVASGGSGHGGSAIIAASRSHRSSHASSGSGGSGSNMPSHPQIRRQDSPQRRVSVREAQGGQEEHGGGHGGGSVGYTADHLAAVMKPVALTMILASWIVANIREASQDAAIEQGLSVYMVYNESPGEGAGTLLGQSIINAIVIVCAICAVTFVLVLCYKYRCIKCMIAYLIFASASLLGYSGGFVVMTAFEVYDVIISWPTFVFIMYNFSIAGVVAVFWQKGIPRIVTQGYLVCVSCIMAWIVVKLPEWTSWTLLVALALYDLCAVLTPCGPLRALVKLAQERPEQPIPGLLYEADVGGGPRSGPRDTFASGGAPRKASHASRASTASTSHHKAADQRRNAEPAHPPHTQVMEPQSMPGAANSDVTSPPQHRTNDHNRASGGDARPFVSVEQPATALAPRNGAGAGIVMDADQPRRPSHGKSRRAFADSGGAGKDGGNSKALRGAGDSYVAMPESVDNADSDEFYDDEGGRSIKLGLGDFVFYSVLVSRAALFGFATFAACFVAVIMGLVGTLLLLGIFKKALPALPISIALGVTFYFTTRLLLFPLVVSLTTAGVSL